MNVIEKEKSSLSHANQDGYRLSQRIKQQAMQLKFNVGR